MIDNGIVWADKDTAKKIRREIEETATREFLTPKEREDLEAEKRKAQEKQWADNRNAFFRILKGM